MFYLRCGFALFWFAVAPVAAKAQVTDSSEATTIANPVTPSTDSALIRKLKSPRATMKTFLDSVNNNDLSTAALCLDISTLQAADEARK